MKYQIRLIPISPFNPIHADLGTPSALEIQMEGPEQIMTTLAVICNEQNKPNAIRISVPGEKDQFRNEIWEAFFTTLTQHMLTCLRIAYRSDIYLFPGSLLLETDFPSEEKLGPIGLNVIDQIVFLPDHVGQVFGETFQHGEELRLYVEGGDQTMPMHYRFMSYYKLFELNFKNNKNKWTHEFIEFTQKYSDEFKKYGFNKQAHTCIHDIRDNCAHIIMNNNGKGISALNNKDSQKIDNALLIVNDICRELLMNKMPNIILNKPARFGEPY